MQVTIEAPVHTTEDEEKVVQSVRQIFPDADIQLQDGQVTATTASLDTLLRKTREERVQDAARGALWRGRIDGNSTRFEVNKQAAYVGRINFNEVPHPLGDLVVTVVTDDLDKLLDQIAPPTRAELQTERTADFRARLHQEEDALAKMGKSIETGFDDEPGPPDEDPWAPAQGEGEAEDEDAQTDDDAAEDENHLQKQKQQGDTN